MDIKKTALFGGALFAAGLTSTAQAAPEFTWDYSTASTSIIESISTGAYNFITDSFTGYGNGGISVSYTFNYGGYDYLIASAETSWDENGLEAYAYASPSYGYARVDGAPGGFQLALHYFSVTENGTADFSFDFTNITSVAGFAYGTARLFEVDALGALLDTLVDTRPFSEPTDPLSGTETVSLNAGSRYLVVHGFRTDGFAAAPESASVSLGNLVPAPSSLALVGLAGIAGVRRRRA